MHEFSSELISRSLDGDLSPAEQAEVEHLLATNADAQALHAELRELRTSLRALPTKSLPGNLADAVLRQIAAKSPAFVPEEHSQALTPATSSVIAAALAAQAAPADDLTDERPATIPLATIPPSAPPTLSPASASSGGSWRMWPNVAAAACVLCAAVTYMLSGNLASGDRATVAWEDARNWYANGTLAYRNEGVRLEDKDLNEKYKAPGESRQQEGLRRSPNSLATDEANQQLDKAGSPIAAGQEPQLDAMQSRGGDAPSPLAGDPRVTDSSSKELGDVVPTDNRVGLVQQNSGLVPGSIPPAYGFGPPIPQFNALAANDGLTVVHVDIAAAAWQDQAFRKLLESEGIRFVEAAAGEDAVANGATEESAAADKKLETQQADSRSLANNAAQAGQAGAGAPGNGNLARGRSGDAAVDREIARENSNNGNAEKGAEVQEQEVGLNDLELIYVEADAAQLQNVLFSMSWQAQQGANYANLAAAQPGGLDGNAEALFNARVMQLGAGVNEGLAQDPAEFNRYYQLADNVRRELQDEIAQREAAERQKSQADNALPDTLPPDTTGQLADNVQTQRFGGGNGLGGGRGGFGGQARGSRGQGDAAGGGGGGVGGNLNDDDANTANASGANAKNDNTGDKQQGRADGAAAAGEDNMSTQAGKGIADASLTDNGFYRRLRVPSLKDLQPPVDAERKDGAADPAKKAESDLVRRSGADQTTDQDAGNNDAAGNTQSGNTQSGNAQGSGQAGANPPPANAELPSAGLPVLSPQLPGQLYPNGLARILFVLRRVPDQATTQVAPADAAR